MVTCDQQEKVSSSQKILLWIFLQIRNLIWRYAELNRSLVGSGLIPLNIELQQDDFTFCCGHNTVVEPYWRDWGRKVVLLRDNWHMFLHIFELRVLNKNNILDKTVFIMWPQILKKIAEKPPLKPLKEIKKSTKTMILSTIFGRFRGLNDSSYQISEATFQQVIFS